MPVKITESHDIVSTGGFAESAEWRRAWKHVRAAIRNTDWPHGSGIFTIRPESGKKRGEERRQADQVALSPEPGGGGVANRGSSGR
ncbi:MAG: hypothetical protein IPJ95_01195 [Gemmatimonadetes bacterium]|nr:hypothetical protein [Gemmatimonadota bacterium]